MMEWINEGNVCTEGRSDWNGHHTSNTLINREMAKLSLFEQWASDVLYFNMNLNLYYEYKI